MDRLEHEGDPGARREDERDFFISYTSADREWAEWIAWQLEEGGYSTVLQAWDFVPGSNFVVEMDRAARIADRTIAVLSSAYLSASFPPPEWATALAGDPQGLERKLVPVRIEECQPEGLLGQVVYTDLVGLSEQEARGHLLVGVSARLKPPEAPSFPGATREAEQASAPTFPGAAIPPLTCVIADDHEVVREGVVLTLEAAGLDVVGQARDGEEALALIESRRPRIALLDVHMPKVDGIEVARRLQRSSSDTAAVLFTMYDERAVLVDALDAGVRGYILKDAPLAELLRAIRVVAQGGVYVDGALAGILASPEAIGSARSLTGTEREILRLLADGTDIDDIGESLGIPAAAVQEHVDEAMRKLRADTGTQAVAEALRRSLIA